MRNDDKYFISNYNIYVDLSAENGFSYVFNTSSRMLISIKGEITNKENLSTAVCSLKKDEIALLKKAEIIHENFNEDELLLNKINNIKKSKQKLMITIIPTDGCNFKWQYLRKVPECKTIQMRTKQGKYIRISARKNVLHNIAET